MEFYEVLKQRRSIRNYRPDPVSREVLEKLSSAVAVAPSANNRQPWKFLAVTDPARLAAIREACPQRLLENAPAIVVVAGNGEEAWRRPEGTSILDIDIGIAMEHLVLAATAEGLGSCWVCAYNLEKMTAALGLEAPWQALALTPLGYPAAPAQEIARKRVRDIFEIQ